MHCARKKVHKNKSAEKQKNIRSGHGEGPAYAPSEFPVPGTSSSAARKRSPDQLFRKDLTSATMLPPSGEDLAEDAWQPDFEKGVQVPAKPDAVLESNVIKLRESDEDSNFKLPSNLIRLTRDSHYDPNSHSLNQMYELSKFTCRYDLDDLDAQWLNVVNEDRSGYDMPDIDEGIFEIVIEKLEDMCHENLNAALKTKDCDICQSPDSEDGNEIVFCDRCKICVHQSCYGIAEIPEGSWICRTCSLGIKRTCVFCPNEGAPMKPTKTGDNWCHVSCAMWLPEVTFDSSDKMEPVIQLSIMRMSRWSLQCVLCNIKFGACIQCSADSCNVAYHVTCAYKVGLRMKGVLSDDDSMDLKSYCPQHTLISDSDSEEVSGKVIEIVSAEKYKKLQELNKNFFDYVNVDEIASNCRCDKDIIELVFNYWTMKRMFNSNKPLLPPRDAHENDSSAQENNICDSMKRQMAFQEDLDHHRNLLYMVNKRDELSQRIVKTKYDIMLKQMQKTSSK